MSDIYTRQIETPCGTLLVEVSQQGLHALEFASLRPTPSLNQAAIFKPYPSASKADLPCQVSAVLEVALAALRGEISLCKVPIAVLGTQFQRRVWRHLQTIPAGTTRSYSQVAREIGHPKAARAVANACASNRLALIVPCHRVVREDRSLGGFRWGAPLKHHLLELEQKLYSTRYERYKGATEKGA